MRDRKNIKHNILIEIIAVLIVLMITGLSFFFIYYQQRINLERADEVCIAISTGIASISVEAIIGEEPGLISDYIRNLKAKNSIIKTINVYKASRDSLDLVITPLTEKQKTLSKEKIKKLFNLKEIYKEEKNNQLIFYYPLIWKVKINSNKKKDVFLGVAEIFFSKDKLFNTYYSYRNFLVFLISVVIMVSSFLIYFYVIINRKLEEKTEMIRQLSLTDELTKIYNRKKVNESLKDEINRAKRYKDCFTLIMFDIDHFKKINDNFGHDTGDMVLKNVVKVVGAQLRITDVFGRWGGEEFIIICPNTYRDDGVSLAERIRFSVEKFAFPVVKNVSCSFGVTEFINTDNENSILKRVDDALYQAKEKGRNRVVCY